MARIAGVDLPRNKRTDIGLTYIYGIGKSISQEILAAAEVNENTRVKDLTEDELGRIRTEKRVVVNRVPLHDFIGPDRTQLGQPALDFDGKGFPEPFSRKRTCGNPHRGLPG